MSRVMGASLLAGLAIMVVGYGGLATSVLADGAAVDVTVSDFNISPNPSSVGAGEVTFNVANTSSGVQHEFVVVKTDVAPDLFPRSADDPNKVDEEAVGEVIDEVEEIMAGSSASLTLNLDSGNYVLICNLPGHYALGMHTAFTVTEAPSAAPEAQATEAPSAAPEAQAPETPVAMAPPASGSGGLLDGDSGSSWIFAVLVIAGMGVTLVGLMGVRSRDSL